MFHCPQSILLKNWGSIMFKYFLTAVLLATPACHAHDNQGFFAKIKNWWYQQCGYRTVEKQQLYNFEYPIEWTFDEVIGLEHIKAHFEAALAYAEDPVKFSSIAGSISTHFVFYGKARTSKSWFAGALAGEMKKRNPHMRILKIPNAMFSELGMQQTIELIRDHAPCVVIIDELPYVSNRPYIDDLLERGRITTEEAHAYYKELRERTINTLKLLQRPTFSPSPDKPIFMIFSSSNVKPCDVVGCSGLRSMQCIQFTLPTNTERAQFIRTRLELYGYDCKNFDIDQLAQKTDGLSFFIISLCIQRAMFNAEMKQESLATAHIIDVVKSDTNQTLEAQ